jgi:hypothetical protein
VLLSQIVNQALHGEFDYDKVLKIAADNADAASDLKVFAERY